MRTALDYIGFVAYLAVMNGRLPDPELLKAAYKGRNGDWKAVWDEYNPPREEETECTPLAAHRAPVGETEPSGEEAAA